MGDDGQPVLDCDFSSALTRIISSNAANYFEWLAKGRNAFNPENGWSISIRDIYTDPDLTLDPKRYGKKVITLRKKLEDHEHFTLGELVDFLPEKTSSTGKKIVIDKSAVYQYVEIQDIGHGDYYSKELLGWELPSRAKHLAEPLDIYIGSIWGSATKWCYIPYGDTNTIRMCGYFSRNVS